MFNEFPIDLCFFVQEMPARALDNAGIPIRQARFALRFRFRLDQVA